MISGIGIDVMEIARFHTALSRYGQRLLRRVFTADEVLHCQGKPKAVQHFAGRFAVKEAVAKALERRGAGIFRLRDIEVRSGEDGKPRVQLGGFPALWAEQAGVKEIHISISHQGAYAVAVAVAEREDFARPARPSARRS